ncbi:glycosyl transferase family 90-domain-containing protein [Mycena pura]|uniref:Glycosyl transferase family 90-domain-containing protein n=1 Tax=Mycena pura TaxID=153505 RepID=A0AAD6VRE4_9AGAR|nr:glycosyl transferase family 90-domain-containing protein [Mycena pura]
MRRQRGLLVLVAFIAAFFIAGYFSKHFLSADSGDFEGDSGEVDDPESPPWQPVRLAEHDFLDNGLLEVNPGAAHPIYGLIRRAEGEWRDKLVRASTTLPQAVAEYRRRYKRHPPKGFDGWWNYVRKHAIKLPDEYDSIHADLEPFWGIEPTDLFAIRTKLEAKVDSYTIGKTATSRISVVNTSFAPGRHDDLIKGSKAILDLLRDVEEFLPQFRAVFSPHDGPNRFSDYFVESAARQAAAEKRYIRRDELPKIDPIGWLSACASGSPGRNKSLNLDGDPPPKTIKKTFIYDHNRAMDPCLHPRHFWHHGQFLSHGKGPTPQHEMVPEFSYCSTHIHHNIRFPTPYSWVEDIFPRSDDPAWDEKSNDRAVWRGSNTGIRYTARTRWQTSHRIALMHAANDKDGNLTVLSPTKGWTEPVGEPLVMKKSLLNPGIFDVAFAGNPILCDEEICKHLQSIFPWQRRRQSVKEAGDYKYVIDVDGNGWSGRFKRLMTTNSLVFKATIYPEWFIDRIAPWVHYVPIQVDLSDLHDALVFFRGDVSGMGAHDGLAHKIADAGRRWSKQFWRREDMVAYFYRLILEYVRLMSEDREAMSYLGFIRTTDT